MISDYLCIKKQIEVIFVIILAIWTLSCDQSPSELNSNLEELWKLGVDEKVKEKQIGEFFKNLLAFVLLTRAYTSKLFLSLYVVILLPTILEGYPCLLIPWLYLAFFRSILLIFITNYVGCYSCYVQKGIHLICLDFVIAQCLDHGPPIYAWFLILSYYYELKDPKLQKTKSQILQTTENLITDVTLTNLMLHLKPFVIPTRSLDTLLSNTDPLASNYGENENGNLPDFVKKVLEISDDDIHKIQQIRANNNLKFTLNKSTEVIMEAPMEEEELICLILNEEF